MTLNERNNIKRSIETEKSDNYKLNLNDIKEDLTIKNDVIIFLRAARSGDLFKIVQLLDTKKIVDINCSNANGLNALHLASKDGHLGIVSELLKRGINVDNATKKGNTALHIASLAGQKEVVQLLIEFNADVNVQSLNGFTPLYMAAQENHFECVRLLLSKGAIASLATEDGFTPLAVAMQQGNEQVVSVLLENDIRGKVRLPALHIAAKKNDVASAKLLLQNVNNPDIMSKSGFTPLHIASHYGNVEVATLLIDEGADVNFAAKHNITPLHVACKWGRKKMVLYLISKKANVCAITRDGLTPLHCAARSGHVDVLEILLKHSSPIAIKTKNGLSALHMAAQGEHEEVARVLLQNGANVNEVTTDFLTPLHVAAHCGHVRVAQTLLNFSADVNSKALNGFSPLHIACKKNRMKMVEFLLSNLANINAATESGLTPLHVASFMGCVNIVLYLLQNGATINSLTVRGETPLHLAVRSQQIDIIKILLQSKASVNCNSQDGQTPLHVAVRLGNTDIVKLLLLHGSNTNAENKDKYTSLHIAAKEGFENIATLIIANKGNIEAKTRKNFTPLHLACKYGQVKIVQILIDAGAEINAKGKNDITPLHVASHYSKFDVVDLLLQNNVSVNSAAKNGHNALHIATKKNEYYICEKLVEAGLNLNSQSRTGLSPLHIAVQEGNIDLVKLFLQKGADVNLISNNGLTPLHIAAQNNRPDLLDELINYDANINIQTNSGYTPLHVAAYYGQIDIVHLLLERNANIDYRTNTGNTPQDCAEQQGHETIVNLLSQENTNFDAVKQEIKDNTESITHGQQLLYNGKRNMVAKPENIQEAYFSDSDDDIEPIVDYQQYKYMAQEAFKPSWEQSHHRQSNFDIFLKNNILEGSDLENSNIKSEYIERCDGPINKILINLGFLVSFLVDARGGSMKGARNPNIRVLVPPKSCAQPTRITCRFVKLEKVLNPPVLMEGEALVSRIMELSPVNNHFLGPVIFEFPHFGSLRNAEREIVVLRSDNSKTWSEHVNDEEENLDFFGHESSILKDKRIVRIVTKKFPYYFAVISRIKQEIHVIGPEGGTITSTSVPQIAVTFPQNALTKKIRVGLQAQNCYAKHDLVLAASPVITIEPRRRKFHKAINLSIPAPVLDDQNINTVNTNNMRLLCSISGGQNRSAWEDVTGSTPLTFIKNYITFTTTVSARFWIINCLSTQDASNIATEVYSDMTHVPYMAKFIIIAKNITHREILVSVFCVSDEKDEKSCYRQQQFHEIIRSKEIELFENQDIVLKFSESLNRALRTKKNLQLTFKPFLENKQTFIVEVKNVELIGKIDFYSKSVNLNLCSLEICLKSGTGDPPSFLKVQEMFPKTTDFQGILAEATLCGHLSIERADFSLQKFCEYLGSDWVRLAHELKIPNCDIELVCKEFPNDYQKQALVTLRLWMLQNEKEHSAAAIQNALCKISREDVIEKLTC